MQIGRIKNATRVLGKSQGYIGLPIRDEIINCKVNGENTRCMVTAWIPTPKEIEAINKGAPIHVIIHGMQHPPMIVEIGELPEEIING